MARQSGLGLRRRPLHEPRAALLSSHSYIPRVLSSKARSDMAFGGMALRESVNQRSQCGDIISGGPLHDEIAHRLHAIAIREESLARLIHGDVIVAFGVRCALAVTLVLLLNRGRFLRVLL